MSTIHLPLPESASLLVIDIQERLLPAMPPPEQVSVLKHVGNLVQLFSEQGGTCLYTEQYPRGLGPTVPELAASLAAFPGASRLEKLAFSACQEAGFLDYELRRDVVLVGMEAHVCVLLTGLDLLARDHRVFVPFDAVASRDPANRDNGLALLERAGATIVNTESVIFAALGRAGTDAFKRFSARVK